VKNENWRKQLEDICGSDYVLNPQHDDFPKYEHDETEDLHFPPQIVVKPSCAQEIQEIVKLAKLEILPIVPRGGGTGLSGGALAVRGGILLSMERMNRILDIDEDNFFAVVEPGIITQVFQETLEAKGLFYPPDPASRGSCTIGGNISENAGGPRAVKYGVTKDYIYGLKAVLANGELATFGGKRLKDVTGYNLVQLLVGSEGTLGIITEATIKIISYPKYHRTLLAPFDSVRNASEAVPAIMKRGIVPCALELMEQDCLQAIQNYRGVPVRFSDKAALVLMEVDGNNEDVLDEEIGVIAEVLEEKHVLDIFVAANAAQQKEIWELRRTAGEAVKSISTYREVDTVVPRSKIPDLVEGIHRISGKWGLTAISYGHAGDGNIHCNLLKLGLSDDKWELDLPKAAEEILTLTVSLGGTISGEHGIGYTQRRFLPLAMREAELATLRAIKNAFDPDNLLNPDKAIFPESL
jgi:glycolate oxidase